MCFLCEFNRQIELKTGGYSYGSTAMRAIAANELIGENFASFTRGQLNRDGFIDIYLHTPGGAVTVGGGGFGSQTISTLPISAADQQFLQDIVLFLDQRLAAEFRFTSDKEVSDIQLYYDSEISLGGDTLGLATTNNQAGRDWWELFINTPAFGTDLNYLRYSLIHELGHALGLEHPFDNADGDVMNGITDPWQSAYPEDTVMAYRSPLGAAWPNSYSLNDLKALSAIWGVKQRLSFEADTIVGQDYGETINGSKGDDVIKGMGGDDLLFGGKDSDFINGNKGNDYLLGDRSNDTLRGGQGDDLLDGGTGDDIIWGDLGTDIILVSEGVDMVCDFDIEQGDKLALSSNINYTLLQQGSDLLMQTSLGTTALLGIDLNDFNPSQQIIFT